MSSKITFYAEEFSLLVDDATARVIDDMPPTESELSGAAMLARLHIQRCYQTKIRETLEWPCSVTRYAIKKGVSPLEAEQILIGAIAGLTEMGNTASYYGRRQVQSVEGTFTNSEEQYPQPAEAVCDELLVSGDVRIV